MPVKSVTEALPFILNLTFLTIVLQLSQNNINLTSIYIKPDGHYPVNSLTQLISENNPSFISGDINTKSMLWNCPANTQLSSSLHSFIYDHLLSLHASNAQTRIFNAADTYSSIFDFAITKNCLYPITTTFINYLTFDHLPVSFKKELIILIYPPVCCH